MPYDMTTDDRRGFALPAVIGALTILGILSTAGFFMARQELRIGVASNQSNLAVNIAQMGANEVMADWNGYQLGSITPWDSTVISGTTAAGNWRVSVVNANGYVYRLTARGDVTEGGAMWAGSSRTITVIARMLFANINPPAALTTRGSVEVKGANAQINGTNTTPTGWGPLCTTLPTNNVAGVVTDASGTVTYTKMGVIGNPATVQDPAVVSSTFTDFGNLDWAQLRALAIAEGKVITAFPVITNTLPVVDLATGRCNEALLLNWGDSIPANPCGAYFPLIYHGTNLDINSSSYGQGILLVEGSLRIQGGYRFRGIIITQGDFFTAGTGAHITGAVMAGNNLVLEQTATGNSQINYSRCAVTRAILNNANLSRARPLDTRSWVDLSATMN